MALPTKGQIIDGYRFLGGDPNDEASWAPDNGLKPGAIVEGHRYLGGDPNEKQSWQSLKSEDQTRTPLAVVNDTAIEAANAVLGSVGAVGSFISPGNRVSKGIDELIEKGEKSQSDPTRARKAALRAQLEGAEGIADEAGIAARYALENPVLTAGQAVGSFALPGGVVKSATAVSRAAGLGTKGVATAGTAAGAATGAAMGGGDAAGQAYELVMKTPADVLEKNDQYLALREQGLDDAQARDTLATEAARKASIAPAAIGALSGAVGVERLLAGGKGFSGGLISRALKTGAVEAVPEGIEEGVTGYSGRAAAATINPNIDPMKGVGAEAVQGAIVGFVPGATLGALDSSRQRQAVAQQALDQAQTAGDAAAAANQLAGSVDELTAAVNEYLSGTPLAAPAAAVDTPAAAPAADTSLPALRARVDREAELLAQAGQAGTDFERRMALDQLQATRPDDQPRTAASFVGLTPMNERQASQRLAVMRDMAAREGGDALSLSVVPHPSRAGAFAIGRQQLPSLDLGTSQPTVSMPQAQQRLETAALTGRVEQQKQQDMPRQVVIDRALRNVEQRGGVASPAEAQIFQEAGLGQPYDRIDTNLAPALSTDEQLTQATGIALAPTPRSSGSEGQRLAAVEQANAESMSEQAARAAANQAQAERQTLQQIQQTSQPAELPQASEVISALIVPGSQRSAEQVSLINQAQNRYDPADFSILQRAATAPFQLAQEERMRLRELRNGPTAAQPAVDLVAPPQQPALMGSRVAQRLGLPSNGRIVTSNAKLSTQRVAPGATVSVKDGGTDHQVRIVEPARLGTPGRMLQQVARVFGKRLVVFESDSLQADGFVMDGDNRSIYINAKSQVNPLAVFGHELTHLLKRENPQAYAALEAVVQRELGEGALQQFEQEYGQGANVEELASDLVGNRFQEADFWQSVFDEIAAQNPEGARGIIMRLAAALNRAVNSFLQVVRQPGFQADRYVKDLNAVKAAVKQALAQYAQQQREPAMRAEAQADAEPTVDSDQPADVTLSAARRGGVAEQAGDFTIRTQKDGTLGVAGDVEAIRALLPEGIKGRGVPGGLVFTTSDAPRVRAALEGRKIAYSRAGQVIDKLPMKNGKYVGAPEKYNTPAKISTLRKNLRKLTLEGERGRYWYENSSREVLQMVGGNVQEARKFVALLSIYSPQAKVDANSTFALRAWAQYRAGQKISVKTGVQDNKAQAALDDVDAFWSGEKTGNFFTNLLREIDPTLAQGATIDMWMMRAAEYNNDAPTATQYAFMENETNRLAQELGWEPQQVQAAIWVAMKARMENAGVKKRTEASSEKKGWIRYDYPLKNGRPTKTRVILNAQAHRDNWLKHAFDHTPTKEDTEQAKFDFSDGLRRHVGQLSWEARPGRSTNVLPGVNDAPYEQQVEFQQAVQKALLDDNGVDLLAYKLGLLVDGPDILAPGIWQGEIAAGMQKLVAMAPAKGDDGKTSVDPAQKKAVETYAAMLGLLLRQEGVGYHRPFYAGKKAAENAMNLDIGRTFSPDEAQALWAAIDVRMRDAGATDWENGAGLISSPNGMRVVNFGAVPDNTKFKNLVKSAAETLAVDEVKVTAFSTDGDLIGNDWKENRNGEGYRSRISEAYGPDLLDWARDVLAPRVQSVFDEFSSRYGWGDAGRVDALFEPAAEEGQQQEVTEAPAEEPPAATLSRQRKADEIPREELAGRKLRIPVLVEETGQTATITMDAKSALDDVDEREDSMRRLLECLRK